MRRTTRQRLGWAILVVIDILLVGLALGILTKGLEQLSHMR